MIWESIVNSGYHMGAYARMSKIVAQETWSAPDELGPCACSQVRRTARKLSLLYDHALAEVGLTVTQYAVLLNVARVGQVSRTHLASTLGMDRTTLTRNLGPLEKAKLIVKAESEDRRERMLGLSEQGKRRLRKSYLVWRGVQSQFVQKIGARRFEELNLILRTAEEAAESVLGADA